MKRIILLLFLVVPRCVLSQDYILRTGNEVYKYNSSSHRWSAPLPLRSTLNDGDTIRSNSDFTVEIAPTWWDFIGELFGRQRIYNFKACKNAVRLSTNLPQVENKSQVVGTRVHKMGDNLAEYLYWICKDSVYSSSDELSLEFYQPSDSLSNKDSLSTISMSRPLYLSIYNNKPDSVFVYVFWTDSSGIWSYFYDTNSCVYIPPFSYHVDSVMWDEKTSLGAQKVVAIANSSQTEQITEDEILSLLSLLNNIEDVVVDEKKRSFISSDVKRFKLIR